MSATTDAHGHDHFHGLVHDSIKRSREGVRAVLVSLAVLGLAALARTLVFVLSGSVALLADLIHNFGDALTAVPLGIAFLLRSERAERGAGLAVVAAIFVSACVAGAEAAPASSIPARPTISSRWRRRAPWATSATSSPPGCAPAPANAWTAPRSSPTVITRAPTRTCRWP